MADKDITDHDLLIRLDTKFEDFVISHNSMWGSFTEIINKFMTAIEKKADKVDISEIKIEIDNIKKKVDLHDTAIQISNGKKEFAVQIGEWGIKGWGAILATIGAIVGLIELIKK